MFVMMIIYKFEVIMLLSSFQGLKAGAQIRALKPTLKIESAPTVLGLQNHNFSVLKLILRVASLKAVLDML
jgi:hypothetical protein